MPPIYRIDPFTALPQDYSSISITWNKPSGTIEGYRLLKNYYGCPVDQDDGEILLDVTSGYPGNNFTDTNTIPGAYHYYGFYVLVNSETDEWVRSGLTGCLMVNNYNSAQQLQDLVPNFYMDAINGENELVNDPVGNSYLSDFLKVLGWGFDYLHTQYDTYLNVNDPWKVPLNNLYTMADQFGININPDIHPYTLRKAVYYNATVNQLRGTTSGIATELSALTGWNADITTGPNMMLDNDQSYCADPSFSSWSQYLSYNPGEIVQYGNYWYQCIATGNIGSSPTGNTSSNTWWQVTENMTDDNYLFNTVTGGISTWETLYPLLTNGTYSLIPSISLLQAAIAGPISGDTVSFGSPSQEGSTIIAMFVTNNGLMQVTDITYSAIDMTQVTLVNDAAESGTGYVQIFYLPNAGTGQEITFSLTDNDEVYCFLYEAANLGTAPLYASYAGAGNVTNVFACAITAPGDAFFIGAEVGSGSPSVAGWTTSSAGEAIGGYLIGSGEQSFSGSLGSYLSSLAVIAYFAAENVPPVPLINEIIGVPDPLDTSDYAFSNLGAENIYGSSTDIWMRSVSRTIADTDTVTTNFAPDKYQAMADGIPVPYAGFSDVWNADVMYSEQDIVLYSNQPFVALRASRGSVPPYASAGSSDQDWAPLSFDQRFRICISAYETASSDVAVYPFIEWYDAGGNYIMRVIARNPDPGSVAIPNQLCYDSFTTGAGSNISSRITDDSGNSWTQQIGGFTVSPFANGCVSPATPGSRSIASVNPGGINCQVGLTFLTDPEAGQSAGLAFRYSDANNYFRADMTTLKVREAGTLSTLGTYSTPFSAGDRMIVQLNGNTITVLRNNVSVLSVTNSFNNTATVHGIINETT